MRTWCPSGSEWLRAVGGRAVQCVSAPWVGVRDAFAADADDRRDVRALCERFGLDVPAQYR